MVEVAFLDSETGKTVWGVVITCPNFCDASGTSLTSHTTDVHGKVDDFPTTLAVDAFGK